MNQQLQERIAQFRNMVANLPDDELGHFRLGQLLMEANDYAEAIPSFRRAIELSPQFSKVYQLLGTCLLKTDQRAEAIEVLQSGWKVADERGDRVPRDEMAKILKEIGEPIPEATASAAVEDDGPLEPGAFRCQRPMCNSGKRAKQLAAPPLPDAVGAKIYETICAECWNEWFRNFSVKVINELRIDLSTEFGQEEYDKHMRDFFGWEAPA